MKKELLIFITITSLILLSACQQSPKNNTDINEVNALLRNIAIEALKNQEYAQAQRSINALILNNQDGSWDFIQSAIIGMPKELAFAIIDNALKNETVQSSSQQLFALSKIYISFKETDLALATINKAIELDKNNLDARYWRARLLSIMKKYDEAEIDFKYITKKAPENEDYSSQYASYLQETKQFQKAQAILATHKKTPDLLFKRIIFALQNKDEDTAKSVYETLKNLQVDDAVKNHKNFMTADAAYWLEKFDDSEKFYRQVLGGKHYLDAREMLTNILVEKKRYDEAKEILHQLENAEEKYAVKAYRLEAQIDKEQKDDAAAIETLTNSLKILPNNPTLLYDRAMMYESIDQMDKAEADLLQIIKDDPKNFEAYNALGYSLADHDMQLEKAYEYVKKANLLSPDNAAIIDSLGWAEYKLGKYTEAEAHFKKALGMSIKDPELYIHLYKTLLKLDKADEAQAVIKKANDLFPDNEKIKSIITTSETFKK
jgi:tetratricopeptide (TPR) repeat protein